jgi:hypothetical protein
VRAAREGFERGRETLAHVAYLKQRAQRGRGIPWAVGGGSALIGTVLGSICSWKSIGTLRTADDWGALGWAAWLMQANPGQAIYQIIDRDNPGITAAVNEDIQLGNAYAGLRKCEADAARTGRFTGGRTPGAGARWRSTRASTATSGWVVPCLIIDVVIPEVTVTMLDLL